MEDDEKN